MQPSSTRQDRSSAGPVCREPLLTTRRRFDDEGPWLDVLATRDALITAISELRGQMLMLRQDSKSDNRLLAENLVGVMQRLDRFEQRFAPPG